VAALDGVDPCGERGEYHTFAFAGPPLMRPLPWRADGIRTNGTSKELANVRSG
jgi:diphthamide synthase (EF-2-diphthine--ammonia ligase)